MGLTFYKYQATGNDFVLIDNRSGQVDPDDYVFFEQLCHRRFGVGADGVILLGSDADTDFAMHYYNADGRPGSMCGNGGRAVVRFAQHLGLVQQQAHFVAIDGLHEASMEQDQIWLKMGAVSQIEALGPEAYYLDTGSPHYVRWCQGVQALDVYTEGRAVR
ncbi:MAG: diaminopimelate epimerase, partial [bacterium]